MPLWANRLLSVKERVDEVPTIPEPENPDVNNNQTVHWFSGVPDSETVEREPSLPGAYGFFEVESV